MRLHAHVRRLLPSGFARRLLISQALVLLAGAATTWLVATLIAPGIFHEHLSRAGVAHTEAESRHVESAFHTALLISISIALVSATVSALAVTWYLGRRVHRSVRDVSDAVAAVAAGDFSGRVADPGLGQEFSLLAASGNTLAGRLAHSEEVRRRMLADLAHEMRTPLATIDAHLEAVEDGVRRPDAATWEVLRSSTHRLRRLADDLSSVSDVEEGLAVGLDAERAAELCRPVADAARARYEAAGVALRIDLDPDPWVLADADRFGQVLGNLLDNALRHSAAGGSVLLRCTGAGQEVRFVVQDDGEGIASEHLDLVFERFYRASPARDRPRTPRGTSSQGSGIGLSIARSLVLAHHGSIAAASDGPGRGATFTVVLPRLERPTR